jgi:DNA-binding NtrC family response regulator
VIHLHLPPLRDIREEIPVLANHFLKEYCRDTSRGSMEFAPDVLRKLTHAPWPGNVRQLRNEVTRLAACARGSVIEEEDLWEGTTTPEPVAAAPTPKTKPQSLKKAVEDLERSMISEALTSTKNNQQQAAKMLGLSRQGLINKLKRYEL